MYFEHHLKTNSDKTIIRVIQYTVLSLSLILIAFPDLEPVFSTGLDNSLPWAFNYLINGNLILGKEIIFPHGPLAFLLYPLPMGHNLYYALFFYLFIEFLFCVTLIYLFRLNEPSDWFKPFMVLLVLLHILDIQLLIIGTIAICFLICFETGKKLFIVPAVILSAFALYIKSYVGLISGITALSFIVVDFFLHKSYKWSIVYFFSLIFCYPFIWLLLYGDFHLFSRFLYGISELASGNSVATAFYPENNWALLTVAILLFAGLPFIHKDKKITIFYSLLSLASLAAWKHGIAREDIYHYRGFFVFLILFFSLLAGYINRAKFLTLIISVAVLGAFYLNMKNVILYDEFKINIMRLNIFKELVFNNNEYIKQQEKKSKNNIKKQQLESEILKIIGDKKVDVYPWDYSFIPANNLNWMPRPVLQSYASYTGWLDMQNSNHFQSAKAPDFILWEIDEINNDINGGKMKSIDNRYLLNDEPNTIISILSNYHIKYKTGKMMVWEKQKNPVFPGKSVIGTVESAWNEWIEVPAMREGILRAKLSLSKNLPGMVKSFFYKDDEINVYYLLENEEILIYRIVPENAADGLWINPMVLHPENNVTEPLVKKIQFRSSGKNWMNDKLEIKWEVLEWPGEIKDRVQKNDSLYNFSFKGTLELFSKNIPDASELIFSGIREFTDTVKAFNYSSTFSLKLDSITAGREFQKINITADAWVMAPKTSGAVLVISIEENNSAMYWEAVELKDFIIDETEWNYISIKRNPEKNILNHRELKIYVWNNEENKIVVNDLRAKILVN